MQKNKNLSRSSALVMAVIALVALAGCTPTTSAPDGTEATLVIGSQGEVPSLDPETVTGTVGLRITDALYETLVREDLKTETTSAPKILPALAEKWAVSEDGLTYDFTIRSGVKFHDGTTLTAEAVDLNFKRITDKASPGYSTTAEANMRFLTKWIDGTSFSGENTFSIKLKSPFAELPRLLSDRRMGIISPAALNHTSGDLAKSPDGTGPFKADTVQQGKDIKLMRNDDYWGGKPHLKGLVFTTVQDANTMVSALQTGQIDAILSAGAEQVAQLKNDPSVVVQYPSPANQYFIRLNTQSPGTDNKLFRQALNFAIDRQGLAAATNGQVTPSGGPLPKGNAAWAVSAGSQYSYDPDKARELLKQSGVALPAQLELLAPSGGPGFSQSTQIMSLIQQNLQNVGINLHVQYMDFTSMVALEGPGYKASVNGSYNGWTTGADSAYWLESMFSPDLVPPKGANRGWYQNPKLTEIFQKARVATDEGVRNSLYREAAQVVGDDAPWVFLYQDQLPRIFSKTVKGIAQVPSVYIDYAAVSKG